MKTIYGNNFFISIAYTAENPTQAAKTAQLFGCTKDQIRSIRNASVFLRDHGEEAFMKEFSPFEIVDCIPNPCKTMTVKLQVNKLYEQRPLNELEFNIAASVVQKELSKLGIDAQIEYKKVNPYTKSKLIAS